MSRTNLSIVAIITLVLVPAQIFAWTGPTATAPDDNTETPINVSGTAQAKAAGLLLNTGGATNGLLVQYGNVGIGDITPSAKLEVSGGNGDNAFETLRLSNPGGSSFNRADMKFYTRDGVVGTIGAGNVAGGVTGLVLFGANSTDPSDTPHMFIKSNGNVGIGTAEPGLKLEVVGSVRATAFYYTSDKNLKKDIKPLENSLSKILNLQGVSFSWKDTGEKGIGLVAQNVEKIYPELVNTNPESGIKSVEYGNLVAPLIEAVKAQQKEIDALKKEIEVLKK